MNQANQKNSEWPKQTPDRSVGKQTGRPRACLEHSTQQNTTVWQNKWHRARPIGLGASPVGLVCVHKEQIKLNIKVW